MDEPTLDPKLLPRYVAERAREDWDFTLANFFERYVSADLAVACMHIFWPSFVERQGCVILAHRFTERGFDEWWEATSGNVTAIESVMNHTHLCDLFLNDHLWPELDDGVIDYVGQTIAQMWTARLAILFPGREFVVEYSYEQSEGSVIYLYQK